MVLDGPSIATLHFIGWTVKVKSRKKDKIVSRPQLGRVWSDLFQVKTTTFQFRGGYACCALHCKLLYDDIRTVCCLGVSSKRLLSGDGDDEEGNFSVSSSLSRYQLHRHAYVTLTVSFAVRTVVLHAYCSTLLSPNFYSSRTFLITWSNSLNFWQ